MNELPIPVAPAKEPDWISVVEVHHDVETGHYTMVVECLVRGGELRKFELASSLMAEPKRALSFLLDRGVIPVIGRFGVGSRTAAIATAGAKTSPLAAPATPFAPKPDISGKRRARHANVERRATLWEITDRTNAFLDRQWLGRILLF